MMPSVTSYIPVIVLCSLQTTGPGIDGQGQPYLVPLLMLSSHGSRPDPHDPSNRPFTEEHTIQSRSVYIQLYVIRMGA